MNSFPLGMVNVEINVEFRATLSFCTRKLHSHDSGQETKCK